MKKQFLSLFFIIFLQIPLIVFAQNLKINLYLENIQITPSSKNDGSKVYFIIHSISNQKKKEFYTVPGFVPYKFHHAKGYLPTGITPFPIYYWSSQAFSQLKHVDIWNGVLKTDEVIELNISVMQRHAPPWSLDEELGVIKSVLQNKDGHLKMHWEASKKVDLIGAFLKQPNIQYAFRIKQNGTSYQLNFLMAQQRVLNGL